MKLVAPVAARPVHHRGFTHREISAKRSVQFRCNARGRIVFDMPLRTAQAAIGARVIGARIVAPSGDIFFGFQQTLRDGLVAEMIRGCLDSRTPANPTMIELPVTDFPG